LEQVQNADLPETQDTIPVYFTVNTNKNAVVSVDTTIPPDVHDHGNVDNQITSEVVSGELNDVTGNSGEVNMPVSALSGRSINNAAMIKFASYE